MSYPKVFTAFGLVAALALVAPDMASAQKGGGGGGKSAGGGNRAGGGGNRGGGGGNRAGGAPNRTGGSRGGAVRGGVVRGGGGDRRGGNRRVIVGGGRYYGSGRYYSPRYYYRGYTPRFNLSFFWGTPGFYGAYGYGSPWYDYGYSSWGYVPNGYVAPYGYGYSGYSGRPYGGVRVDVPERDAEVFVDGYFVGNVDDFDGRLQQANLEAGAHHIEITKDGFEPITFDVNVEVGRTITYRGDMQPPRNEFGS